MRISPLWFVAFLPLGCAGNHDATQPGPGAVPAQRSRPDPAPAPSYEVHEWGLLRAGPGDVLEAGSTRPPRAIAVPMAVDKPVLYFHSSEPLHIERVRVESIGGTVREHWPLANAVPLPRFIEWRGLALDRAETAGSEACAGVFPSASAQPCSDLPAGEECESRYLASLRAASATCVQIGDARLPFLFYRSRTSTFTPPLRIAGSPTSDLLITNTGDASIPGWIVRIRRDGGQVRTIAARGPGAGETISLGSDFANAEIPAAPLPPNDESVAPPVDQPALPGSQEPGRRAVRLTLDEIGLDVAETDAFLRAWDGPLFGDWEVPLIDLPSRTSANAVDRRDQNDDAPLDILQATDRTMPVRDTLLYFLPAQACDGVSRLSFTPTPARVVRALALWQPAP